MIKVIDFPTDIYNRYMNLTKELSKATGVADRSQDNADMLVSILETVVNRYKTVQPATPNSTTAKPSSTKTTKKS